MSPMSQSPYLFFPLKEDCGYQKKEGEKNNNNDNNNK
jgi:hypothetical protein